MPRSTGQRSTLPEIVAVERDVDRTDLDVLAEQPPQLASQPLGQRNAARSESRPGREAHPARRASASLRAIEAIRPLISWSSHSRLLASGSSRRPLRSWANARPSTPDRECSRDSTPAFKRRRAAGADHDRSPSPPRRCRRPPSSAGAGLGFDRAVAGAAALCQPTGMAIRPSRQTVCFRASGKFLVGRWIDQHHAIACGIRIRPSLPTMRPTGSRQVTKLIAVGESYQVHLPARDVTTIRHPTAIASYLGHDVTCTADRERDLVRLGDLSSRRDRSSGLHHAESRRYGLWRLTREHSRRSRNRGRDDRSAASDLDRLEINTVIVLGSPSTWTSRAGCSTSSGQGNPFDVQSRSSA